MVKRRILAAITAVLLAGVSAVALLAYVTRADSRAMAGMQTVKVLVADKPIPKGTPVNKLSGLVSAKTVPAMAAVPGKIAALDEISGKVAAVDLHPGEQLLVNRFTSPESLQNPAEVGIPKGMQSVSLVLEPQRVVGGTVATGSKVGVFVSLAKDQERPPSTHLVLHSALVIAVQGGAAAAAGTTDKKRDDGEAAAPEGNVMVTLALRAPDAEKVVFGAEHGTVWLSQQPREATTTGTRVVTDGNVYR